MSRRKAVHYTTCLLYIAGLLALILGGAGALSIDRLLERKGGVSGRPKEHPQRGESLLTAWDLITLVTGREEPEVVIDPDAKGDPLFEKGNLTVSGDFDTTVQRASDSNVRFFRLLEPAGRWS